MWGELLLCSSFFRNLTKSSYCVSYFFLLLRTLYLISSYSETVAGGCPTLVLLKRENNAKRGCLCRKIMPCPSYSHMQDRSFFFKDSNQSGTWLLFLPLETPLFALQSLETWLSLLQGQLGTTGFEHWHFTGIIMSMASGVTRSGWDTRTCLLWAIKLKRRASFFCPVLSGAERSLIDEKGLAQTVSRIWQTVL